LLETPQSNIGIPSKETSSPAAAAPGEPSIVTGVLEGALVGFGIGVALTLMAFFGAWFYLRRMRKKLKKGKSTKK
jgi:hypothetical protein